MQLHRHKCIDALPRRHAFFTQVNLAEPASMPSLDQTERKPGCSTGSLRSVHVRFNPAEGRRLQRSEPMNCPGGEPLLARRPVLMERADGTYELIGTSRNLAGLARWILSFGTGAKACGPGQLQREVALQARRIWQQYDMD